ncbi:MAG: hypothetical protein R3Y09_11440 [Clostridia bacterium]
MMKLISLKFEKPFSKRHVVAFVLSLVLLISLPTTGVMAWLATQTQAVTNVFKGVIFDLTVTENFTNGDTIKEDVYIENTGDVAMYIRVKLSAQALVNEDDVVGRPVVEADTENTLSGGYRYTALDVDDFDIVFEDLDEDGDDTNTGYWFQVGNYYYYSELVEPGEKVLFINEATLNDDIEFENEYTPSLVVMADGVQANMLTMAEDGQLTQWLDYVYVETDGTLADATAVAD